MLVGGEPLLDFGVDIHGAGDIGTQSPPVPQVFPRYGRAAASPVGCKIQSPVRMSLAYTIPVPGSIATPQTSAGPTPKELAWRRLVSGTN